ncbi:MAG: hypothetical protein ACR2OZ_06435 [Verrucomicrobiales bacterium]
MKIFAPFALALGLSFAAAAQEDWNEIEPIAQSIERLDAFSQQFVTELEVLLRERGQWPPTEREQILNATACGLRRSVACLRKSFFSGAAQEEIEERIHLSEALAARVRGAANRVSLFQYARHPFIQFQNELDWLKKQLRP